MSRDGSQAVVNFCNQWIGLGKLKVSSSDDTFAFF
jgi:hypothetical protein